MHLVGLHGRIVAHILDDPGMFGEVRNVAVQRYFCPDDHGVVPVELDLTNCHRHCYHRSVDKLKRMTTCRHICRLKVFHIKHRHYHHHRRHRRRRHICHRRHCRHHHHHTTSRAEDWRKKTLGALHLPSTTNTCTVARA